MSLLVLVASIRETRVGRAVGDWVVAAAQAHAPNPEAEAFDIDLVDLRELRLPLHDEPHHPKLGHYIGEPAKRWSAQVAAADAMIFVMPEYNHSFSAPLKNAIDYLHAEWSGKPVGVVSYGGLSGGTRAVVALQPVMVNLGMRCLSTNVEIAWVSEHVADGVFTATDRHDRALAVLLDELVALRGARGPA
ncbi:NAD(P)H-dependent oxidoreductase [Microbacterium sp. cx-55]|uniref:NADPH-dependent FMN reductase n=1 Tax=unclassified Microbacterium TaxID=2609290 RepID=UPI001CBD9F8D|nr:MULTISPECIES: NAD(P)H-dependent oxidoreductase [unclassified Microbacterium]MBZ4487218.1 NAD(P)H-dependent oxidoreductase [Microbacterium sp. cx-55]MCC4908664.1 NAD(P)H-dependent oxidoreductase [Microbacterium sp. cx-59]UGB35242.1 NAD(P)H-dependent oxidoreductase [Microbacterium sp. cx-55]